MNKLLSGLRDKSRDVMTDNLVALGIKAEMAVYSHSRIFQGWTLELGRIFNSSKEQWKRLEKVANYLIASPR